MKKLLTISLMSGLMAASNYANTFNDQTDLLVAQFDCKPDPDDIQSIAALGSMLAHDSFKDVEYYAVAGAYGTQNAKYIDATELFDLAFGTENTDWTDAHNHYTDSVTRIKNKAKAILLAGGKVWVQEAGQSDITRDWVQALLNDGVSATTVKNNVIVVQHSEWNQNNTSSDDLAYIKENTTYEKIADGNDEGNGTPGYRTTNTSFHTQALNSSNATANALWTKADDIIQSNGYLPSYSTISTGGVDFSDCSENWWIFGLADTADSVSAFWDEYVINSTGNNQNSGAPIGSIISLQSVGNGKYVAADRLLNSTHWPLAANRAAIGAWEEFEVIDAGGGYIAFLSEGNGKYVAADKLLDKVNWRLAANRTGIGSWEKFEWVENSDGTISLLANGNGKYVSSDNTIKNQADSLAANESANATWEKFTFSK